MYKNEVKHRRAIAECGPDATEAEIKAKYLALGGLYEETGVAEHMTTDDTGPVSSDQAVAEEEPKHKGRGKK